MKEGGINMSVMATPPVSAARRAVVRVVRPSEARHGAAFSALRLGGSAFGHEGDPVLNLDHFRMAGPTFPPHAHAGFSAITYMLPESDGGMLNRDSRGDRSLIPAGGLHWTAAGAGIVHEEVPDRPGITVEGFQIFIRQPVAQETLPPVIHHVDPQDLPTVAIGGGTMRVLAGNYDGHTAAFETPSPLTLLDIALPAGETFVWTPEPDQTGCAIYLFGGVLAIEADTVTAPALILFARSEAPVRLTAQQDARLLLIGAAPLDAPSVSNGPFVLSSQAALDAAVHRYHSGAMGRLTG